MTLSRCSSAAFPFESPGTFDQVPQYSHAATRWEKPDLIWVISFWDKHGIHNVWTNMGIQWDTSPTQMIRLCRRFTSNTWQIWYVPSLNMGDDPTTIKSQVPLFKALRSKASTGIWRAHYGVLLFFCTSNPLIPIPVNPKTPETTNV